ncbi:hypothetical protein [Streptomyces sp. H72]
MAEHGTVARKDRVTVPSPGCLVVVLAPIVIALIASLVLLVMHHRQESSNSRNEAEAVRTTASLARAYAQAVLAVSQQPPDQDTVRGIAARYDGRLASYTRSDRSLTTTVRFFAEYRDTSMFGTSYSRVFRCYSIAFKKDVAGEPQEKTTSLDQCDVSDVTSPAKASAGTGVRYSAS